jgi:hypothetical protein
VNERGVPCPSVADPERNCRHGHNSARPASSDRPRNLYVREDVLLAELAGDVIVDAD